MILRRQEGTKESVVIDQERTVAHTPRGLLKLCTLLSVHLIVGLALFSYQESDLALSQGLAFMTSRVAAGMLSFCGVLGAYFSWFIVLLFILGAIVEWPLSSTRRSLFAPLMFLSLILPTLCAVADLEVTGEIYPGGTFGWAVGGLLMAYFGCWRSMLLLGGLTSVCTLVIFARIRRKEAPQHAQSNESQVAAATAIDAGEGVSGYPFPPRDLLNGGRDKASSTLPNEGAEDHARGLCEKLEHFGVQGTICKVTQGPVVTFFEYEPRIDAKISKITALEDDLALAIKALSIRIIAPVPGRSVVGFEVAHTTRRNLLLGDLIQSTNWQQFEGGVPLLLGADTAGAGVFVDLVSLPHLLVAGSTGSGKSVALNAMLLSLLYKKTPEQVRLILIDPKRLEFSPYAGIPHLLFPLVVTPREALGVLKWAVKEMEDRYAALALSGARSLSHFYATKGGTDGRPFIVIIIDELADLMMAGGAELEQQLVRLAQMSRAAGIHLVVATQRPSVDVITGLIKVNFPSRIAFRVSSKVDSRTILDANGADKLLGKGDMLFLDATSANIRRLHGAYVSDDEISAVVEHIKSGQVASYEKIHLDVCNETVLHDADEVLYQEVCHFLQSVDEISVSLVQRRFRIGYNRSARIIDKLELDGLIAPSQGGRARRVLKSSHLFLDK